MIEKLKAKKIKLAKDILNIKLEKLFNLCDELNISLDNFGSGGVIINDTETGVYFRLADIEDGRDMYCFPPCTEARLVEGKVLEREDNED